MPPDSRLSTLDLTQPAGFVLADLYGLVFDPPVAGDPDPLRALVMDDPVAGLQARVNSGQISRSRWLLYTAETLVGGVRNGGIYGFLENHPGLVTDVRIVLQSYAPEALAERFALVALPCLDAVAEARAAPRPDPTHAPFWAAYESALAAVDPDREAQFDAAFFAGDAANGGEVATFQRRVLADILSDPGGLFT